MAKAFFVLGWIWRWSLLVTVPIAALFVLWISRTGHKYHDLGIKFRTLNDSMSLHAIGSYEASCILRDVKLGVRPRKLNQPATLRQVELYLPESAEAALNDDLPHSGREYVEGSLIYPDGGLGEVKVRYRGDHFWHWGGRKKSLRVKTKKSALYDRIRAINFSVPKTADQIVEQLSNELVGRFDLIGPKSEMVELWVNGERRGLHLQIEQLEEMVIRTNGRMPGDLYSGDIVGRNVYRGVPVQIFHVPGFWEKVAINNHFDPGEDANLRLLLRAVSAEPSAARTKTLRDLVDLESFARFAAFKTLCQTFHFDNSHNHRLYYDPWRNHFVPVVWDPGGWHPGAWPGNSPEPISDVLTSDLDIALFQDPEFLALRQAAIEDWFVSGKHDKFMERAHGLAAEVDACLDRDPGLGVNLRFLTPESVRNTQKRVLRVMEYFSDTLRDRYLAPANLSYAVISGAPGAIRIESSSRRIPSGLELEYERPMNGTPRAFLSFIDATGASQRIDVSSHTTVRGHRVTLDVPLPAQFVPTRTEEKNPRYWYTVQVTPAVYQLTLVGAGIEGNSLVRVLEKNYSGLSADAVQVARLDPVPMENVWAGVSEGRLEPPVKWSGDLYFEGVRTITDDVIIEPGTTITMGPDASIIFQGRVLARGTAASPIRVLPVSTEGESPEPFGTFALRGPGADSSVISFMEMRLGSGLMTTRAEFSAMFSIHDVDQVVIQDCSFYDSRVVDDMVHAVYSTVRFERCTFVRSLQDALDIDISEAVVRDCTFVDSGNDGLDLMTSTVAVIDSEMLRSGDKGASVGEDTQALFVNCSIVECVIGVEIKDRSRATLANCEVLRNDLGVNAYKKNWRYDSGGFGFLYNCTVESNKVTFTADKVSKLQVHDCFVAPPSALTGEDLSKKERRRVLLDRWCDGKSKTEAAYTGLFRYPDEPEGNSAFLGRYRGEAEATRRGPKASGTGD